MKDRDFLCWLHERLVVVHREDECLDYMHKLRAIIKATLKDQDTPNTLSCNNLEELKQSLED